MRFGGGGISWESLERFESAVDWVGTKDMMQVDVDYEQECEHIPLLLSIVRASGGG